MDEFIPGSHLTVIRIGKGDGKPDLLSLVAGALGMGGSGIFAV